MLTRRSRWPRNGAFAAPPRKSLLKCGGTQPLAARWDATKGQWAGQFCRKHARRIHIIQFPRGDGCRSCAALLGPSRTGVRLVNWRGSTQAKREWCAGLPRRSTVTSAKKLIPLFDKASPNMSTSSSMYTMAARLKSWNRTAAALKGRCVSMSYPAETDRFFLLILVPDGNVGIW